MKEKILNIVKDLVSDFCYYDRKECETLTVKRLQRAIRDEEVTIDEIVATFRAELEKGFK